MNSSSHVHRQNKSGRHLLQAGEPLGLRPVGFAALNMLRVEAGIPWYGLDMDEGRIVLEVGLEHAISFKKGCYLGQEVVERATARGHVNRKLSGLLVHGNTLPESGDKLFHDSQEVGWVTSAVSFSAFWASDCSRLCPTRASHTWYSTPD